METPAQIDLVGEKLLSEAVLAILKSWLTDAEVMDVENFLSVLHHVVAHLTQAGLNR